MPDHSIDTNAKNFKSPLRKLVYFFEESRNRWKSKYKQIKSHPNSQPNIERT